MGKVPSMATTEGALVSVPADVAAAAAAAAAANARPKRVRTGCLTCRERHLKCDEGLPDCQNCKKSSRTCKRGVRLNFIDTRCEPPPITPPTEEWEIVFQDESREIASEYQGGLDRYSSLTAGPSEPVPKEEPTYDFPSAMIDTPVLTHQQLPTQAFPNGPVDTYSSSMHSMPDQGRDHHRRHSSSNSDSTFSSHTLGAVSSYTNGDQALTSGSETRTMLTDPQEVLFMQVFVEEVAIWMDSMDPYKHFSRLLPFDSLGEPMLLNAFLACGARHLTLVNPAYEDKLPLSYYQASSNLLLRQMQNPYRDTVICATTAVVLNVYETMTEKALQRMNHIAGARALIKECGWNATSVGIGAACFWLNVGIELLSCLHFNWQVAWNPDDWGVDMDLQHGAESGREEIWTHRIMWIVAKIANFRASMTLRPSDPPPDHMRLTNWYEEWKRWKDWIDAWENSIPRTMRPLGRLQSYQTATKSLFPEVWLVKRATTVARMFYHTGISLLSQTNPLTARDSQVMQEMHDLQMSNARELCGIVAHVKDRGVASVALRSLATVSECITMRAEQDEVLTIFDRIRKETGWRIIPIQETLKKKWGYNDNQDAALLAQQQQQTNHAYAPTAPTSSLPPAPPQKLPPVGIINPAFAKADFAQAEHPYQAYYVPPAPIQPPAQHAYHPY